MALDLGELSARFSVDLSDMKVAKDKITSFWKDVEKESGAPGESTGKGFGKKAAVALGGAGLVAGGAFAASMVRSIDLDAANDKMAAGLGLTAQESQRYGKVAGDLYAGAYGESIEDVNAALESVTRNVDGMSAASNKSIEDVTAKVMDLSTTFDQDLGKTTGAVGQMIRTGMAKDANEALDLLTVGLQGPANKADDLMDTFNEYGTQFRKVGIDGKTAMGMLSQGMQAGARDSDIVADSIKEFSIRSQESLATLDSKGRSQLTPLGQAFYTLGLNGEDMQAKIGKGGKGAADALDTVLDRLRGMQDPVARTQTAVALFGTQAEDLGDALYALDPSSAVQGLGDVAGAADKMDQALSDNAATSIESLKRKGEQLFTRLSTWALPILDDLLDIISDDIVPALSTMGSWIQKNSAWLLPLVAGIGAAVGVLYTITTAVKVWTAAQAALNIVLDMNPIGLIVMAIAGLVAGIIVAYKKSDTFRAFVDALWASLKSVAGWIGPVFVAAIHGIGTAFGWVKDKVSGAWGWVKDHWPLLLGIITGPIGMAVVIIVKHWDAIKGGAAAAKKFVTDKFNGLVDFVTGLPGKIGDAAKGMWDGVKNGLKDTLNAVIGMWNGLDFKIKIHLPDKIGGVPVPGGGAGWTSPDLFPDIPELAEGAWIPATPGGVVVRTAEAGKAEIVAPEQKIEDAVSRALDKRVAERGNVKNEFVFPNAYLSGTHAELAREAKSLAGDALTTI